MNKVWHKFEKGWHGSEHYQAQWAESRARMGIAQCCLGSAQCEHRMSPAEKEAQCAGKDDVVVDLTDNSCIGVV